jgi:Zn-dependent M28 family amino/carboxypeptidase
MARRLHYTLRRMLRLPGRAVRLFRRLRGATSSAGRLALFVMFLVLLSAAWQRDNLQVVLRGFTPDRIRSHILFLSDDLLEGRAPGTRGGRIAGRYIAAHFERAGLLPPPYGYYQQVSLLGWRPAPDRIGLEFEAQRRRVALRYPSDVILWTVGGGAAAEISGEVVFVGYGVHAPEYDWDDFEDTDLRGKVLLFLAGDPPSPPEDLERFDGIALTWYGRWDYKLEEAARRGAAAALIIHTEEGAGYPWSVVRASWTGEQLYAAPQDTLLAPPSALEGWIRSESARFVLGAAGLDLDQLIARAESTDFRPIPTGISARARAYGSTRTVETANVIGVVPGRDTLRRDEAVVYTAHYDHLGIGPAENGDSIYNGAYDNASGVSLLLEVASAFARLEPAPGRTIILIATAAEEAGQLGAKRYVMDPLVPMERTAAVVNIDGANLWGATWDVAAVGSERSTLGRIAESRARDEGLRLAPERSPEKGFFFRSDHFPFARAGVPALYVEHGLDYRGRPSGWGAATLAQFEMDRYHRPSDRYQASFDLAGAVQQARFAFLLGYDIARTPDMPRYNDGSGFQRVRERN